MIAPKGGPYGAFGHRRRQRPTLVAVSQDASGNTMDVALSYAAGIGGGRLLSDTFKEECETDFSASRWCCAAA